MSLYFWCFNDDAYKTKPKTHLLFTLLFSKLSGSKTGIVKYDPLVSIYETLDTIVLSSLILDMFSFLGHTSREQYKTYFLLIQKKLKS